MTDEKVSAKPLSMANTKKEMIDAYQALLKQLEEKEKAALKPEKKLEEKKKTEVVEVARSLSTEGVARAIGNLKIELNAALAQISERLEQEVQKFQAVQKAIESKEKEFQEVYEIERTATTLAALIEAQNQRRNEFELEMAGKKEQLDREITTLRLDWEKEKKQHEAQWRERESEEKKRRERETEEFDYNFERERRLAKDKFEEEKATLEKELTGRREQLEKDLLEREKTLVEREKELAELRERVGRFPGELEAAVNRAVREVTERLKAEARNREELAKREFDGEKNVLTTRIASLEKTVEQQSEQLVKWSQQLEMAYQKVQDIALKAVEGSSGLKSLAGLQQLLGEPVRKPIAEK